MRRPWLLALLVLSGSTGCRSCTRRECDPAALVAHCSGNTLVWCAEEGFGFGGIDHGTRKASADCGPKNVCIDDHRGAADCVHAPATRCEGTLKGAESCDGNAVLVCMPPSVRVAESYVVTARTCFPGERCVPGELGANCEATPAK